MLKASSRCCRDTAARYPGFDAVGWGAGGARGHVNVFEPATPSLHIASRLTDSPCSTVLCRTSTPSASPPPTARHSKPNPPVEYGSPEGQPTPSLGPTRARARLPTLWARGRHSALGSPPSPQTAGGRHPSAPRQQAAGSPQTADSPRQPPDIQQGPSQPTPHPPPRPHTRPDRERESAHAPGRWPHPPAARRSCVAACATRTSSHTHTRATRVGGRGGEREGESHTCATALLRTNGPSDGTVAAVAAVGTVGTV